MERALSEPVNTVNLAKGNKKMQFITSIFAFKNCIK